VRLGWSHGDQEIFSRQEMIDLFDVRDVNASASKFNPAKLRWLNQQYIMAARPEDLVPLLVGQLTSAGLDPDNGPDPAEVIRAYRERAETLAELAADVAYLYQDGIDVDEAAAKKQLRPVIGPALQALMQRFAALDDWSASAIHAAIDTTATEQGINFGKLGQPLRVAVTGGPVSPPIDETVELVGKARTLERLAAACRYIDQRASSK
jgi:glutamyl-tRNA synthetase